MGEPEVLIIISVWCQSVFLYFLNGNVQCSSKESVIIDLCQWKCLSTTYNNEPMALLLSQSLEQVCIFGTRACYFSNIYDCSGSVSQKVLVVSKTTSKCTLECTSKAATWVLRIGYLHACLLDLNITMSLRNWGICVAYITVYDSPQIHWLAWFSIVN